ncbi:hypothetical protein [Devosia sp.]|uniref:hypothetical protein n=1 Tax=Devosia sp. TaxID=1871048 RepID=UPI001AD0751A|nr:hypothetical protein [Devosia sp.]MBN9310604.1 hypothetical protein [Devosia sp.]
MSATPTTKLAGALGLGATLLLGGCVYDYAQHTDRVGYVAGNAVKANMAMQTINPSKPSMNTTTGLGKNGVVGTEATTSTTPTTTPPATP